MTRKARDKTDAKATKDTKETKKARLGREYRLVCELLREGYLFSDVRREADRHTMIFSGDRRTRKYKLVPARVLQVAVPADSWLARWADADAKVKARTKEANKVKARP